MVIVLALGATAAAGVKATLAASPTPTYWATISITPKSGYPKDGVYRNVTTTVTYAYGPLCVSPGVFITWDNVNYGYGITLDYTSNCSGSKKIQIGSATPGRHKVCAGGHNNPDRPVLIRCATFTVLSSATPAPTVRPTPVTSPSTPPVPTVDVPSGPAPVPSVPDTSPAATPTSAVDTVEPTLIPAVKSGAGTESGWIVPTLGLLVLIAVIAAGWARRSARKRGP